jgi:hypothetical protein
MDSLIVMLNIRNKLSIEYDNKKNPVIWITKMTQTCIILSELLVKEQNYLQIKSIRIVKSIGLKIIGITYNPS